MSWLQKTGFRARSRRWLAAGLLGVFLSVFALTLSEALHRVLHSDAGSPQHQCAVTMLQGGQFEAPVTTVATVLVAVVPVSQLLLPEISLSSVDLSLPPSCGPPVLVS
jgi:hypothetical protein